MIDPMTQTIDKAELTERITRNCVTVASWVAACLVVDRTASGCIGELYAAYECFCRREQYSPLPRKTWLQSMKLAGFQTESGAFKGLGTKAY